MTFDITHVEDFDSWAREEYEIMIRQYILVITSHLPYNFSSSHKGNTELLW